MTESTITRINGDAAWTELSKHIRLFNWVQNLGLLSVVVAGLAVGPSKTAPIQSCIPLLLVVAVYFVSVHWAAKFASKYSCPNCGRQFMSIDASASNPFHSVKHYGSAFYCQNCDFKIRNPKRRRGRN